MICKKCGASIPDDSYECKFCGAKLSDVPPEKEPETEAVNEIEEEVINEESASEMENTDIEEAVLDEEIFDENERKRRAQIQRMIDEKKNQLSEIQERREQKRRKQRRNKIILFALLCVALAGAAYGVTYLISNRGPSNVTVTTSPMPSASTDPAETADPSASPEVSAEPSALPSTEPLGNDTASRNTASSGSAGSSSSGRSWSSTGNTGSGSSRGSSSGSSASSGGSSSSGSSSTVSSSNVSDTGVLRTNVNSVLARGGEVVYDSNSGRYIMTFTSGNKRYYAYVSSGSTTAQISGKYMTITAVPTDMTYKGSTIFDIKTLTTYEGDYIIKDSGIKRLTESDISGLSKEQLAFARNEIFARHGRPFSTQKYKDYFAQKSWYNINPNYNLNDDKSNLNDIESENVDFLLKHENNL